MQIKEIPLGSRFNRLTVTGNIHKQIGGVNRLFWLCTCDCGSTIAVRGFALRAGLLGDNRAGIKSCGCLQKEGPRDRAIALRMGRKYQHASILRHLGNYVYEFKCQCGKLFTKAAKRIHARSNCGCLNNQYKPVNAVGVNTVYSTYKDNAHRHRRPFELDKSTFASLLAGNCAYCSDPPSGKIILSGDGRVFMYNGIDRLDNTEGYVQGKVVTCCNRCISLKNKYSYAEFTNIVKRIYENLKLQEKP